MLQRLTYETASSQPVSASVAYGTDVNFSVNTADGPSSYQWQKNGENLFDYDNVAGSQTSMLSLVGVAANDMGNYSVIVSNYNGGSITSSVAVLSLKPTLIFSDTFESGAGNWRPLFDTTNLNISAIRNHTIGGGWSLGMTNSSQKVFHNLPVQYACRVDFSFWFFDDGQSQTSCGGELRGYSGPGYTKYVAPGGLRQLIAIGRVNAPFPTNSTGVIAGEALDATRYQGRVFHGTNTGWFNLNAVRSPGWHRFRIDRSASSAGEVDFYVDGVLARSVTGVSISAIDSIYLGSLNLGQTNGASPIPGNAYYDDVEVAVYPGLFDWQNLTTDGPIPDWMQKRETGTNWQTVNVFPTTVLTLSGSATNKGIGDWTVAGESIYSTGIRGVLDYVVTTTTDDAFRIEVEGRERNYRTPVVDMPVAVMIDGESLGRLNLVYGGQTNGLLHSFTPFIRAGVHRIRLNWDNADPRRSLLVQALRLQTLASPSDSNVRLKGWVANRLATQNGVEYCPPTSVVSPVCMEGRGQFLSMMELLAGAEGQMSAVPVQPGAGYRWYANIPLSASNATTVLVSYQNGRLGESNAITWQVSNLLLETNGITIRKGDALLLTAVPESATAGEVTINVSTNASLTTDALTPVPYQFNQPGSFILTGIYQPTGAQGSITVTVVDASFEDSPIVRVLHARFWDCTNLPPQTVLDADPRLKLVPVTDAARAAQTPPLGLKQANEREFRLYTRSIEPEYILARLGTNGPVMASTMVRGFRWSVAPETYLRMIGSNPDGSQLIETAFVASPVFPSLSVEAQIISSGVTFDDGTVTRTNSSEDFDSTGVCRLRFIRAATAKGSTCHTTKLYDNATLIGWR